MGIGATAVPVARLAARFTGRAIQAWARSVAIALLGQHCRMVVTAVRIVPLVDRRLVGPGRGFPVGHYAWHDGGLQPGRTEQREHRPREGALPSSEPCKTEIHAVHLCEPGAETYPLRHALASKSARGATQIAEHTSPAGRMPP
jgi:hypothetical protein